ncbi:MAG: serine protein kinase RIO [Thermoprotei archaeon]
MFNEDFEYYESRKSLKRIKDKDLFETVEEVFDSSTLMTLYTLMRKRIIRRMNGVISAGKESRVYLAYGYNNEYLAVKIYLVATAVFRKGILKYIIGDPRFEGFKPSDTRKLIYMWTRKEFRNLKRMYEAGVKVPKPIAFMNNVLVMEFLGEEGKRYPLLIEVYKDLEYEDLLRIYNLILDEIEKIVCRAKLVHGDLSEYNVVVKPDIDIAIIDVSQAVDLDHPSAYEFLVRDVENINRFFRDEAGLDKIVDNDKIIERLKPCLEKRRGD